jgi:hypothetical protein
MKFCATFATWLIQLRALALLLCVSPAADFFSFASHLELLMVRLDL